MLRFESEISFPQVHFLNTCSLAVKTLCVLGAELDRVVTGSQYLKTAPTLVLPGSLSSPQCEQPLPLFLAITHRAALLSAGD